MTRLRVREGESERLVALSDDRVVLGRQQGCEIVLNDPGVSREHAELTRSGSTWWIADLDSRNGTFLNDTQIDRERLRPGDVARLGPDVTIELLDDAEARPATHRAAPRDDVDATHRDRPSTRGRAAVHGDDYDPESSVRPAREPAGQEVPWWQHLDWTLFPKAAGAGPVSLKSAVTTVGRDPSAGLSLADETVSRMHARIDRKGTGLQVTDLKSSNGTKVNGEPVLRAALVDGDQVAFGDVEFTVEKRVGPAWGRIGMLAGGIAAVAILIVVALRVSDVMREHEVLDTAARRVKAQALDNTKSAIDASRDGDPDMARAHLLYAADLLLLSDLAPAGATLAQPALLFREIARDLPADQREFDFKAALDPDAIASSQARLASLTNREYVEHQVRRYAVELGQDPQVPAGFIDQVWTHVDAFQRFKGSMQIMLRRSRVMQPRIRQILVTRHLPEAFCYVAWVESGLDPMQRSPVGAVGLWQLMPATAAQFGLRVNPSDLRHDERTQVERSTMAAADYIATLLRAQGPEYFMLVLASYNRGHNALERAKQKVDDPMLPAQRKYWYLVEHALLPEETRNYVPKIFAVRVIAEAPERFGFETP
jgi:pSer/pThr/pTyr-binding forkhead associated (FHA) protein